MAMVIESQFESIEQKWTRFTLVSLCDYKAKFITKHDVFFITDNKRYTGLASYKTTWNEYITHNEDIWIEEIDAWVPIGVFEELITNRDRKIEQLLNAE
jgi:hypothetical protein